MTLIDERVALARAGENPTVICQLPSGWAVLGDHQFLPGYCLLLPDPVVERLTDLEPEPQAQFLGDMARLGAALLACTDAIRINYEILGNSDAALHAHVFARYASEPEEHRRRPVWQYPLATQRTEPFNEDTHGDLRRRLAAELVQGVPTA